jgi:protein-S-isoprenylcysteine O-methyltransferase Ste14
VVRLGNFLFHYRNGLFPAAFVLLLWPGPPIFESDLVAGAVGLAVALGGQFLRAVTIGLDYIVRGGKNRTVYAEGLVTGGMFAHCRNPLYDGNLLLLAGVGLAANSLFFVLAVLPAGVFAYRAIIAAEEDYLRRKFGAEFDAYCARVNRFLPNLTGLATTLGSMEFKWRRLLVKEYGTTYAWIAGLLVLVMKNLWQHGARFAQSPVLQAFAVGLVLASLAYIAARYLKKSGTVQAD